MVLSSRQIEHGSLVSSLVGSYGTNLQRSRVPSVTREGQKAEFRELKRQKVRQQSFLLLFVSFSLAGTWRRGGILVFLLADHVDYSCG